MTIEFQPDDPHNFHLDFGLLFYSHSGRTGAGWIATHHTATNDTTQKLGPGKFLSAAALRRLGKTLTEKTAVPLMYLPESVVAQSEEEVWWWRPEQSSALLFARPDLPNVADCSGKTLPQPALLFRTNGCDLSVWALKENRRPTPETVLYHAPYPNIYEKISSSRSFNVCLGSSIPRNTVNRTPEFWEDVFFRSRFTHSHHKNVTKKTSWEVLWPSLIGKTKFPKDELVSTKFTLKEVIRDAQR